MVTWVRSGVHVLLAVSIASNAWLAERVWKLDKTLTSLTERREPTTGVRAPELSLTAADGSRFQLSFSTDELPTLLYVVAPTCGWCAKNKDSAKALATATSGRVRMIGVAVVRDATSFTDYIRTEDAPFPIYRGLTDSAARALNLRSTPTTLLISPDGVVQAIWEGAYGGQTKAELESRFGIQLPGLIGE